MKEEGVCYWGFFFFFRQKVLLGSRSLFCLRVCVAAADFLAAAAHVVNGGQSIAMYGNE